MATRKPSIDQDLIRDLANILNETDLTEIEIEQDDLRVRVSRAGTPQMIHAPVAQPQACAAGCRSTAGRSRPCSSSPVFGKCSHRADGRNRLSFARTGAKPFVEVGQSVKEGQTILIIEAMKTMNQIPAPRAGKVVERSGHRRRAGGIRRTDDRDRVSERPMFKRFSLPIVARSHFACCAPARNSASRRWPCTPPPTRTPCMCALPTRACASARRPRATAISTFTRSLRPARSPARMPYIPGYGFLSENAKFADILDAHGITFIGPPLITSASWATRSGQEDRRGWAFRSFRDPRESQLDDDEARRSPRKSVYPVIIKATAGGGGRGMKVANNEEELSLALSTARSEAGAAFGNDAVYIEKYLGRPATSKSRFWATARATRFISASATARCSAATRRSGKKPTRPR
jgi:acetyl-CoA carboxylase biotin carboxyl carrier protein